MTSVEKASGAEQIDFEECFACRHLHVCVDTHVRDPALSAHRDHSGSN